MYHGGTLAYMSPQARLDEKRVDNDLYALGIVLFQVLNDWRHPSRLSEDDLRAPRKSGLVPEVEDVVNSTDPERAAEEHAGYLRTRWKLGPPFANERLPEHGEDELKKTIYKMIDLSPKRRFKSAEEVVKALESWGLEYLHIQHSADNGQ